MRCAKASSNSSKVDQSYLSGNANDYGYGIAVYGSDITYVTGYTDSSNFPLSKRRSPPEPSLHRTGSDCKTDRIDRRPGPGGDFHLPTQLLPYREILPLR